MKKLLLLIVTAILVTTLAACGSKEKLYVLNWGDYMNPDLIEDFEIEYNVKVVYEEVPSNEEMEVKIKAGQTAYDIAIPSDYMIDKLNQQDLLNQIDYTKLTSLDTVDFKTEVTSLYNDNAYAPFMVPYFWGTIGIMYNTDTVDVADLTGWEVLFEQTDKYDIGMYDSARDAVAAALMYNGFDVNSNDSSELLLAETALVDANFKLFGDDLLRSKVIEENLDMALVYSGDYFDELYAAEEEGIEINFDYYVPEVTNIWVDGFVIPTTSENTELAHKFIDFFLTTDIASENANWVGYAPVTEQAYDMLLSEEYGYDYENFNPSPEGTTRLMFEFVSDTRYDKLNQILNKAKVK